MTKEVVEAAKEAAPNVEGKLVEMLDALQSGAVKVGETVVQYSPDIADAALWVVRIDGAQALVNGVLCLLLALAAWNLASTCHKREYAKEDPWYEPSAECFGIIGGGIGSIIASLAAGEKLFNVWNYVAIFEPKLYLAKQIVTAALK